MFFSVSGKQQRLFEEVEGKILRIAQEFVSNTIQHARARHIEVNLEFREQELLLQMSDDGQGFDIYAVAGADEGRFGITGMRERTERIAGNLVMHSDTSGTRISLRVPIADQRIFGWSVLPPLTGRLLSLDRLDLRSGWES